MAKKINPCPMCSSHDIGVVIDWVDNWVKFRCRSCDYTANYHHDKNSSHPFANAAQGYWNGGRHCEAIKTAT